MYRSKSLPPKWIQVIIRSCIVSGLAIAGSGLIKSCIDISGLAIAGYMPLTSSCHESGSNRVLHHIHILDEDDHKAPLAVGVLARSACQL